MKSENFFLQHSFFFFFAEWNWVLCVGKLSYQLGIFTRNPMNFIVCFFGVFFGWKKTQSKRHTTTSGSYYFQDCLCSNRKCRTNGTSIVSVCVCVCASVRVSQKKRKNKIKPIKKTRILLEPSAQKKDIYKKTDQIKKKLETKWQQITNNK